ncbi:MAG TPA: HAD family hydrolase [Flavobacterium sp.]|jgi:putative hydrolase of the HAD superfamily
MKTKALILDLDNTIFPVEAIADDVFGPLYKRIEQDGSFNGDLAELRNDMMRLPLQKVAKSYGFSSSLREDCNTLLKNMSYDKPIRAFKDYAEIQNLPYRKYLVTMGYKKLQHSKIRQLGIEKDFEEVIIIDPEQSDKEKKDIFKEIADKHGFKPEEIVVIGDDPDSEIAGAKELGMEAILYDKINRHSDIPKNRITDYKELADYFTD